jgi:hypothetical protein
MKQSALTSGCTPSNKYFGGSRRARGMLETARREFGDLERRLGIHPPLVDRTATNLSLGNLKSPETFPGGWQQRGAVVNSKFRASMKALFSPPIAGRSRSRTERVGSCPHIQQSITQAKRWQLAYRFRLVERLPAEDPFSMYIVKGELSELDEIDRNETDGKPDG